MRRAPISLVIVALLGVVVSAPANARGATATVEPLPVVHGLRIENVCPFPVEWTDRGGRTLATRTDRSGRVVQQTITGTSTVELRNVTMGLAALFDIREVTTITYGRDGKATMVQVGSSGIALDPGTATRAPSFTWYGGIALTQGTLDRTFLFSDVTRQRRAGIEGDICEMLVSGLKTRH
ncbi:MAG: hypothetical protein ABWZ53_00580 [Actinomycetota bacterium]